MTYTRSLVVTKLLFLCQVFGNMHIHLANVVYLVFFNRGSANLFGLEYGSAI